MFERQIVKCRQLARSRPNWRVYGGDNVPAIRAGAGADLPVNVLDVDPYSDPWPALEAWFGSERVRPPEVVVIVTDGNAHSLHRGKAWTLAGGRAQAWDAGGYLAMARHQLGMLAEPHGYEMTEWAGYACGTFNRLRHYAARLSSGN